MVTRILCTNYTNLGYSLAQASWPVAWRYLINLLKFYN